MKPYLPTGMKQTPQKKRYLFSLLSQHKKTKALHKGIYIIIEDAIRKRHYGGTGYKVCRSWMGHWIQQDAVALPLLALLSVLRRSVTSTLLFQCMFSLHNICPHNFLPIITRAKHFPIMLCFGKDTSVHCTRILLIYPLVRKLYWSF